jgi:hypothetical protein
MLWRFLLISTSLFVAYIVLFEGMNWLTGYLKQ